MKRENTEKEFTTDIISSGRITIPNHHLLDLDLEEGNRVKVTISKKWYEYPMFYQVKGTDKIEMVVMKTSTGELMKLREEARKLLEGKSIQWALLSPCDWMIKPEPCFYETHPKEDRDI